jgi:hypothetical protein
MLSSSAGCRRWGFDWQAERDGEREMVLVPGLVRLGGGGVGGDDGGGEGVRVGRAQVVGVGDVRGAAVG